MDDQQQQQQQQQQPLPEQQPPLFQPPAPNLAALQDQVNQMAQQIAWMQVGMQAAGAQGGRRLTLKAKDYSAAPGGPTYLQWERSIRAICQANDYTLQQTILATKASLTGVASDMAQNLSNDAAAYASPRHFFEALRRVFVSPANIRLAQADFEKRTQRLQESIRVYHALLLALYTEGWAKVDEAWRDDEDNDPPAPYENHQEPIGSRSTRLIERFISGLRDDELRLRMRDSVIDGQAFDTYEAVLNRALAFMANRDQNEYDAKCIKTGGTRLHLKEFDTLVPQNRGFRQDRQDQPMELGAVGAGGAAANAKKWCTHHRVDTHSDAECYVQGGRPQRKPGPIADADRPRQGGGQLAGRPDPRPVAGPRAGAPRAARVDRDTAKCDTCGGIGHFYRECPSKPRRGRGQVRGRLGAIGEGSEVDDDQLVVVDDDDDDVQWQDVEQDDDQDYREGDDEDEGNE